MVGKTHLVGRTHLYSVSCLCVCKITRGRAFTACVFFSVCLCAVRFLKLMWGVLSLPVFFYRLSLCCTVSLIVVGSAFTACVFLIVCLCAVRFL